MVQNASKECKKVERKRLKKGECNTMFQKDVKGMNKERERKRKSKKRTDITEWYKMFQKWANVKFNR